MVKGFGTGVSEYKEIAKKLGEFGLSSTSEVEPLRILAGYRNRLIHYYHEIGEEELYRIPAKLIAPFDFQFGNHIIPANRRC